MNANNKTHTDIKEIRNLLMPSDLPSGANPTVLMSIKGEVR